MASFRTHYDNLKVSRDAPESVIRAAYRTLSQQYHPDKRPGDERAVRVMAIINQSYEILSDPRRRREHDAWIAREEAKRKQQEKAQSPPIPPQWQQPERTPPPPARGNVVAAILLFPFKLLLKIAAAVPQLTGLALLIAGLFLWDALTPDKPRPPPPPGPKPYQANAPAVNSVAAAPAYVRPSHAPNGHPWPARAAYVNGYPIAHDDGHSKITVDNTQNDSDVFVKLVSIDGETAYPVRQFYIPARSRFTMNDVTAGAYDIRYRDLRYGGLSRSEPFNVDERRTREGIEYSAMTMTLYKVEGGNFETFDLAETEF